MRRVQHNRRVTVRQGQDVWKSRREGTMMEENHPETVRKATTLDSGPTLARGHSVRLRSVDDPYMGVAALLQTLGIAHLLQEFKSRGCHDTLAVDLRADELVKSFGLASVTAQVTSVQHHDHHHHHLLLHHHHLHLLHVLHVLHQLSFSHRCHRRSSSRVAKQ
jgi:hypothetical protein